MLDKADFVDFVVVCLFFVCFFVVVAVFLFCFCFFGQRRLLRNPIPFNARLEQPKRLVSRFGLAGRC